MPPDDDLRGDIESALGDAGDGIEPLAPAPPPAPEPAAPPPPAPEPGKPEARGERDSLGRFLPKKDVPSAVAPGAGAPDAQPRPPSPAAVAPGAATPPQVPEVHAPAGMPASAREHWAQTPPPIREFIAQREQQMARWANDTAPLRNAGQAFLQAIEPYRMTIQAEGVDPVTAVSNLMQIGTTLRFGTPQEKARVIAECVNAYGVDIGTLDSILVGQAPPDGAPQVNVQAEVQRALQPLMQYAQQTRQFEVTQTQEQAASELENFAADPKHEFIDDVRLLMADMIEVASKQRLDLTLQDAYDRACALHPEVSKVIMARRQGASAQQLTQAAQRARSAAVSVRGAAPVGNPGGPEPTSIRESIEAAIEAHSRV